MYLLGMGGIFRWGVVFGVESGHCMFGRFVIGAYVYMQEDCLFVYVIGGYLPYLRPMLHTLPYLP